MNKCIIDECGLCNNEIMFEYEDKMPKIFECPYCGCEIHIREVKSIEIVGKFKVKTEELKSMFRSMREVNDNEGNDKQESNFEKRSMIDETK